MIEQKYQEGEFMYLIKNAWKNVIRSKGRNILIFSIVFAITLAATISLDIRQAA